MLEENPKCTECGRTDRPKSYFRKGICNACYKRKRSGAVPRYRERECYGCGTTESDSWYQNLALGSKRGGEILHELCNWCCKQIIYGTYYREIQAQQARKRRGSDKKTGYCSSCSKNIHDGTCKQTQIVEGKELCASCHARITNLQRTPLPRNKFGMFSMDKSLKLPEEEYRKYFRERRAGQKLPVKDTSIELAVQNALKGKGIPFEKHKTFWIRDFIHPVDIFIEPNICIECDGEYWHSQLIARGRTWIPLQRDFIVDFELEKNGMKVVRLSEWDIKNNLDWCIEFIEKAISIN